MAHGGDSEINNQPESQAGKSGDAAMANTTAQTYSGGEFQSMSQGAYAQSAKDSQEMSQGPNRTLGDLQLSGHESGKDAAMGSPYKSSDAGTGASGANNGKSLDVAPPPSSADSKGDSNSPTSMGGIGDTKNAAGIEGIPPSASDSRGDAANHHSHSGASDANSARSTEGIPPSASDSRGDAINSPAVTASNGDAVSGNAALQSANAGAASGDARHAGALYNFDPKGDAASMHAAEAPQGFNHASAAAGSPYASVKGDSANINPNRARNFESWSGGHSGDAQGDTKGDRQGDQPQSTQAAERYGVPETKLPTPEQVKNAPVEQLQQMAADSRKATEDYVAQQGKAIPDLAFHGTTEGSGKNLERRLPGELWVAGPSPDRRSEGVSQHVKALGDSAHLSQGYADNPRIGGNAQPGPVLVFNASNQPEAWSKTSYSAGDVKYGKLDNERADLLGQVPREQLDKSNKEIQPLHAALNEKGAEYQKQPGGLNESNLNEIRARGQAVDSMHRDRELQMYLGVVAKSNAERGISAQPEQSSNQSFFSRMVSRFRGNSW